MAGFRLQAGILDAASRRFADLADDSTKARTYLQQGPGALNTGDVGWLMGLFLDGHSQAVTKTSSNIDRGEMLLNAVSSKLREVQTLYDKTESDNTVSVNDIFKNLGISGGDPGLDEKGKGTAMGTEVASTALTPPEDTHNIPEIAQVLMTGGTVLVSPTYWLNKVIGWCIGVNPLDWLMEKVAGDWSSVDKAGNAFGKLGDYFASDGQLTAESGGALFRGWDGDAADRTEKYLGDLANRFNETQPGLADLDTKYGNLAVGIQSLAVAVADLLAILLDLLLTAAAAAALVWLGGVTAALLIAVLEMALADWIAIVGVIAWMQVGIFAVLGVIATFAGALTGVDLAELPGQA